jgi:O-antigen/teichoic acid export membrane protein
MNSLPREQIMARSSTLAQNATWMFAGQGLSIVCQAIYFVLLARLLGSIEYGVYVAAVAMVSILSQYSSFGSPAVLLRYVSPSPKKFALYWGNALVTTVSLGLVFVAVLAWAGPHVVHSCPRTMFLCVAIGDCICAQITMAAGRVFQAFEKLRVTAGLNLLTNLLRTLMAGTMLWSMHHAMARQWVVAALGVSVIAACTALALVTRFCGKPAFCQSLLQERLGEGFIFALSASTTNIYNDFDKAMLGHYGMNAANGIYTMAYRVVDVCMMPISSLHSAAFPRFFQRGATGIKGTSAYARRILKRTAPMGLLLGAIMFLAAPLVPRLVGSGFRESAGALRWLCLLPLFRSFQLSAGDALTGAGHQKFRLFSQAASASFNFGTNLYLVPHFGWQGAAWSSLATDGLLGILNWAILIAIHEGAKSE